MLCEFFEMVYYHEQAAAFGLSSVVYVPKIELETVTELSAFCDKASVVISCNCSPSLGLRLKLTTPPSPF